MDVLNKLISENLYLPNVEIEVRFGTLDIKANKFDASVDGDYFKKILNSLNQYDKWIKKENIVTSETCSGNFKENIKSIKNETTKESYIMKKEKILTADFETNGPFDIRLSVYQEFINTDPGAMTIQRPTTIIRNKKRCSFNSDIWRYDLTYVENIQDVLTNSSCEIELELSDIEKACMISGQGLVQQLSCKIYDILNLAEKSKADDLQIKFIKMNKI